MINHSDEHISTRRENAPWHNRDFLICTCISGLRRMRSFLSRVDEARWLLFVTVSMLHNYDARLVSAKRDQIAKDITPNSVHGTVLKNYAAAD